MEEENEEEEFFNEHGQYPMEAMVIINKMIDQSTECEVRVRLYDLDCVAKYIALAQSKFAYNRTRCYYAMTSAILMSKPAGNYEIRLDSPHTGLMTIRLIKMIIEVSTQLSTREACRE